jgi:hypothetical protein
MELDRWLWKDEPHIPTRKLWEYLTRYCYLSRLTDEDVLLEAIREGLSSRDYFAYAGSIEKGRYLGLQFGRLRGAVYIDASSVLVKPDVAKQQLEAEKEAGVEEEERGDRREGDELRPDEERKRKGEQATLALEIPPRRFHGTVTLDSARLGRDAGRVAEEIVQHLEGLVGSDVHVTLEIDATIPGGVPDHVVRTVTENCRVLKFRSHGFEEE